MAESSTKVKHIYKSKGSAIERSENGTKAPSDFAAVDLEKEHELCMAVMNLVALEEHIAFTISKTGKEKYIALYNVVRKLRSKYMKQLVKNNDGEMWCASKHSLVSAMHLIETGIKYGASGKKKEAMDLFRDGVEMYKTFWLIQEIGGKK